MSGQSRDIYRLVLVGDSGSGKSTMLARYLNRYVGRDFDNYEPTVGVDFQSVVWDDDSKFQIWDTAGQERYQSHICSYYRGADAIILTRDLSRYRDSLESLDTWLDRIKFYTGKDVMPPIYLVHTKCDLFDRTAVVDQFYPLNVPGHIRECVDDHHFVVSALTGEGLDSMFETIFQSLKRIGPRFQPRSHIEPAYDQASARRSINRDLRTKLCCTII